MVLYPIGSVLTVEAALREHYAAVRRDGTPLSRMDELPSFEDFRSSVGLRKMVAFEKRYAPEVQS